MSTPRDPMRRKLYLLIYSRLVIGLLLLGAVTALERANNTRSLMPVLATAMAIVGGLSLVYLLPLKTRLPLIAQVYAQFSMDLVVITWLVYRSGDAQSPFVALYLLIFFTGAPLMRRAAILAFGGAGALMYTVLSVLTMSGVIPRAEGWLPYQPEVMAWTRFMFSINLIAIFSVLILSSNLGSRLQRSESELATVNKDLADYRLFNDRIIESVRSGLVTTDLRGHITTFNRAAEEITGFKANEVRGNNVFTIFGDIEKQIEVGLESIRTRTRLPRFNIDCKRADGREIHLGFSVAPLVDEAENTRGYVFTFQDLTEVMELEREMRRQERLAALGKMAAGLAHEIRNPLASMRGSVQVLASELNLSPDQEQLMHIVLRESDRLNRIVSDFLTYARPPRMEVTVIELGSLLGETVALLSNSPELGPGHRLCEERPETPVYYQGDPHQLRQIFWNLARNAIQAMPDGGELRIVLEIGADGDVIISFIDTGMGMTREQQERLFEPFNSSSGGTGLGMAIVYQLVRDHNGKVLVESECGKGTRISIKLPASGRVSQPPDTGEAAEASANAASPVA